MYDTDLVKKLFSRSLYQRIIPYIKEHAVSSLTWEVIKGLTRFYKAYPLVEEVNLAEFRKFFFVLHTVKDEKGVQFSHYFDKLEKVDEDSELLTDVLKNYITKDYATQIHQIAFGIVNNRDTGTIDDISNLITAHNREVGRAVHKDDLFVPVSLTEVSKMCAGTGYNWRLNELNKSLGPLRHGDFIIIAARPETGKTTMVASEVSNFVTQLTDERPIMWVNNEESGGKVMFRIVQSYFGELSETMMKEPERYEAEFNAVCKGRLHLINDEGSNNDVTKLNSMFEEFNPCMIIFDQLDKVAGFTKAEREDLRIGNLYEWGRSLAKKYGVVIAISQCDGTAEGVKYIGMNQLRGSKTDKIGEADAIITIGKSDDPADEYRRYIQVPKNKLFGGEHSDESMRHGKFEVEIIPAIARYKGEW